MAEHGDEKNMHIVSNNHSVLARYQFDRYDYEWHAVWKTCLRPDADA
jgi:hypothetical protein